MKNIIDSHNICISTTNYSSNTDLCFANPDEAQSYASDLGWWCCNCEEAIEKYKNKF